MKPSKIKNQMNKREIQPSIDAWARLEQQLDAHDSKPSKKLLYVLTGVAAILLLALLVYPVFNKQMSQPEQQIVHEQTQVKELPVNTNNTIPMGEQKQNSMLPDEVNVNEVLAVAPHKINNKQSVTTAINAASQTNMPAKKNITHKTDHNTQVVTTIVKHKTRSLAYTSTVPNSMMSKNQQPIAASALRNDQAVGHRNKDKTEQVSSTNDEVDQLLDKAMAKQNNTHTAVASQRTDPTKLLLETEWSLESDKRSRLQHSIQDGLRFLKTEAVALIDK